MEEKLNGVVDNGYDDDDIVGNDYDEEDIEELEDEQSMRQRPQTVLGTNDVYGCAQADFEIIQNAVDEGREGFGNQIIVEVFKDGRRRVTDFGRGCPMGWNKKKKKWNWKLVFCTLYASGKYNSKNYKSAFGLNGLGATATQFTSEFMRVESVRKGKKYIMNFEKGKPVGELIEEDAPNIPTGTMIEWKPDKEVFTEINVPVEVYIDKLRRHAMLHPNLKFTFKFEGLNNIVLHYPEGIKTFLESAVEKPYMNPIYFEGEDNGTDDEADCDPYTVTMDVAITFSRETYFTEMYHNGGYLSDGGVTFDAMWAAIVRVIEDAAKESGKLPKSEKISYKDLEELLVAVGSTNCPGHRTFYKHQTKTAITNPFIRKAYFTFVYTNFSRWFTENRNISDKIVDEVLANKKARESAEAIKKQVIKKLSASADKFGDRPEKFVDCESRNPFERELYIVEGDSALTACKFARDSKFQALMPLRGKIMNCLKEDLIKILGSQVIVDLLRVIGCGIEAESKYVKDLPKFDESRLYAYKIIICTDADLDGKQIRCLVLTMIYRLMPSLLRKGRVFIAETPLYEISYKDNIRFAYDENEKKQIINEFMAAGVKEHQILIQRSKGLGENEPEMMWQSTMNPLTRRLVPVEMPENEQDLATLFNALLGDDLESRRYLIDQYFDMNVDID